MSNGAWECNIEMGFKKLREVNRDYLPQNKYEWLTAVGAEMAPQVLGKGRRNVSHPRDRRYAKSCRLLLS
jgi:hypothetical protein